MLIMKKWKLRRLLKQTDLLQQSESVQSWFNVSMVQSLEGGRGGNHVFYDPEVRPLSQGMRTCCICRRTDARYKCPGCEKKTCSLDCVKAHKEKFVCNGKRDPAKFVSVQTFTDADLIKDFRFLEEVGRLADKSFRENRPFLTDKPRRFCRGIRERKSGAPNWIPKPSVLEKFAQMKGIVFKRLPRTFTKREENTSFYLFKNKTIYWRVCWKFPRAEAEYVDKKVSEKVKLGEVLQKYIDPEKGDPILRHRLKVYCHAGGVSEVTLLMQDPFSPANQKRYFKYDPYASLEENLHGKNLLEYPTIVVILPDELSQYEIIPDKADSTDSEEEESEESASSEHKEKEQEQENM
eukprot:m.9709 g.9709  ORF g.9709 m.9709 type:complete len:350 (+) comp21575_c0_seq2:349-1398(+)